MSESIEQPKRRPRRPRATAYAEAEALAARVEAATRILDTIEPDAAQAQNLAAAVDTMRGSIHALASAPESIQVVLKQSHTHRGADYAPGATIEVEPYQAALLERWGVI